MTKWNIGVSPSGKAADSDSVIPRVQILPPQPNENQMQCIWFFVFQVSYWNVDSCPCEIEIWKRKSVSANVQRTRFLINNQIDSVSLLELELEEKSNLNGSYFLIARSLCWSIFRAFAIGEIIQYFLERIAFKETCNIKTRKSVSANIQRTRFWF